MERNILFVDDDPNMLKMVELFMRKSKHKLSCAKNGRSALKILEKDNFDLVITDIQMPELDGLALIDEIRKVNNDIPIVIISAFGQEMVSEKALEKGAIKVLRKPFESRQLLEIIEKTI